jgi:putative acetyltransferase
MPITISPFTISDYDEAYALWSVTPGIGLSSVDSRKAIQHYLDANPGSSFVAREDGRLVGAVLCGTDRRRGYLNHLAVASSHRGQNLGRELVAHCLTALKSKGIVKCHIFVYRNNMEGTAFWEKIGWKKRTDLDIMSIDIPE